MPGSLLLRELEFSDWACKISLDFCSDWRYDVLTSNRKVEGAAIGQSETDKWAPLTREQAVAARDFSRAGETFIGYKGEVHEVLYSILTPLGYKAFITAQTLRHLEKHSITARHQSDLPHVLNNPDLILPSHDFPATHLYYKVIEAVLFVVAVHQKDNVRFVATMHKVRRMKGLRTKMIFPKDFLYLRGGFKWKKWK